MEKVLDGRVNGYGFGVTGCYETGRFSAVVKGYRVRFIAKGNGRLKGFYGTMSDEGRWSVRGSRLCVMLREWLDGRTTCAPVRRENGDWYRARNIRFRKM